MTSVMTPCQFVPPCSYKMAHIKFPEEQIDILINLWESEPALWNSNLLSSPSTVFTERATCSAVKLTNKCSAVTGMGDRLTTINMDRKLAGGAVPRLGELDPHVTQCGLDLGLPLYQVAS